MTPPEGGYVEEVTEEESLEIVTAMDEQGQEVLAEPQELITKNLTMRGRGGINLAAVAETAEIGLGDVIVTSVKNTESNTTFPTFEISARAYRNLTPEAP